MQSAHRASFDVWLLGISHWQISEDGDGCYAIGKLNNVIVVWSIYGMSTLFRGGGY